MRSCWRADSCCQVAVRRNPPWVSLVGGVGGSLGLGWWRHRWWVVGGRAGGGCTGGGAGCCLRGKAGWRRPGWGAGLLGRLLSGLGRLLRLFRAGTERERERRHTGQQTTIILPSAAVVLKFGLCVCVCGAGCLQRQSWVQASGRGRGRLVCSDRPGH